MLENSQIKNAILKAVENAEIHIINPQNDGLHFEAIVISAHFEDKGLVEQHQVVMQGLSELFSSSLHALSLKTYTPEEWIKVKT